MRKIALMAAAAAIACSALVPAIAAAEEVTSVITAVDTKHRAIILADKTVMLVGDEVDLAAVTVGMKFKIDAKLDEDGYSRATAITPVN